MAQLSARENFFLKKHNKREAIDIQHIPLVLYVYLTTKISNLLISPMGSNELIAGDFSAQNTFCAEDFCSIIIEHVTKKQINCLRKFEGYT